MHPRIFFRSEEFQMMKNKNDLVQKSIEIETNLKYDNINNLQDLYYRVEALEDSENILNCFRYKTKNGYLDYGNCSSMYVDPHALGIQEVYGYHVESSISIFYISIGFLIIFIISYIKKSKFLIKIIFPILTFLICFNLYNYFYVEPKIIEKYEKDYDFEAYKEMTENRIIFRKFDSLYKSEVTNKLNTDNYVYSKTYEYEVYGTDEYFNNVSGKVEVDNQIGGEGVIFTEENVEIKISVKWIDKGRLEGEDEAGNRYDLEVE